MTFQQAPEERGDICRKSITGKGVPKLGVPEEDQRDHLATVGEECMVSLNMDLSNPRAHISITTLI